MQYGANETHYFYHIPNKCAIFVCQLASIACQRLGRAYNTSQLLKCYHVYEILGIGFMYNKNRTPGMV